MTGVQTCALPIFDLSTLRLDRSRPLRDQIYPLVRGLILSGIIRPGAIGVWSPADSVTHFGSLLVGSPSPPAR